MIRRLPGRVDDHGGFGAGEPQPTGGLAQGVLGPEENHVAAHRILDRHGTPLRFS
ncbi:MAG: hypothetical protein ACR2KV_12035 [Solirubrobacteraceae bacterium]